jgi:hypothetical protein
MVTATGAAYVIWSISWWGCHLDAPLLSPDSIVTAERADSWLRPLETT